jgi:erythromycin esterase-like protein
MEVKPISPSPPGSYERLMHDAGLARLLLDLREGAHPALRTELTSARLERFIGVIYRPGTERWSHSAECRLPEQFDAFGWFDETTAVEPLPTHQSKGPKDTYPFGL